MRIDQNHFCLYNREPTLEIYGLKQKARDLKQLQGHTSEVVGHDFLATSGEKMAEACDQRRPPISVKEN
jgi:hypothetical protein